MESGFIHPQERIASIVETLVANVRLHGSLRVGDIIRQLADRSIVIALLLFSLVNSLPMPGIPFFSTVTGIPIMLLGLQLLIRRTSLWLPRRVLEHRLAEGKLLRALDRSVPILQRLERNLIPRWPGLSDPPIRNLLGALFVMVGFLLALPIPFTNFACGLSMSLVAAGIVTRDGLLIVLGIVGSVLALGLTVAAILFGTELITEWLW